MPKKLIIPIVLVIFLYFAFSGCSDNHNVNNARGNPLEKSTAVPSASASDDTYSQNKTLVKVVIKGRNDNEKVFVQPEDIKVFTTSIETGTPIKNVPSELKAPPYFMYFSYSDNETIEYFLYISQNSGWILKNGTREAHTLSKESVERLNQLLLQLTEDEAVAKVVKDHPEFPSKAGVKEGKEEIGGKQISKVPVKYETNVEKKVENTYTITLTKTWGITVNGKTPVSYWKYDVSTEKVTLVDKSTTGEDLVSIIK
jgi:hypothetical protein